MKQLLHHELMIVLSTCTKLEFQGMLTCLYMYQLMTCTCWAKVGLVHTQVQAFYIRHSLIVAAGDSGHIFGDRDFWDICDQDSECV